MGGIELVIYGVPAIPVIVALGYAARMAGLNPNLSPALSIGLGILAGIVNELSALAPAAPNYGRGVVFGIVAGLAASGLYSYARIYGLKAPEPYSPPEP